MLDMGGGEATVIVPVPLVTGLPIYISAVLNLPITAACGVPGVVCCRVCYSACMMCVGVLHRPARLLRMRRIACA